MPWSCWVLRTFAGPRLRALGLKPIFLEMTLWLFMALRRDQILRKPRGAKETKDILCNATHSVWEEENRQSMNLCSKKVCAEQQLYHGGWEQESINGSWMGPLLLDPELSFSPERRSAFTFFSHSFVDHWWWITLPPSLPGWGWWPILSSCDHVCSVTSPPTYVETKSCLTDGGSLKQIISLWGLLIL